MRQMESPQKYESTHGAVILPRNGIPAPGHKRVLSRNVGLSRFRPRSHLTASAGAQAPRLAPAGLAQATFLRKRCVMAQFESSRHCGSRRRFAALQRGGGRVFGYPSRCGRRQPLPFCGPPEHRSTLHVLSRRKIEKCLLTRAACEVGEQLNRLPAHENSHRVVKKSGLAPFRGCDEWPLGLQRHTFAVVGVHSLERAN